MAALNRSKLLFEHPIITILGSTGTGKSKLAIEIAKRFNGEIINADAMQMYEGLNIITNKVTREEQNEIQHHLLGFLSPLKSLTVCEYKNLALSKIKEVVDRKKLPVIVGGTFYYIESVLYDFVIGAPDYKMTGNHLDKYESLSDDFNDGKQPRKKLKVEEYEDLRVELEKFDNEKLYARLKEVDPELATVIHPNCRRKMLRGILAYHQHGETLSSILEKQRSQPGGCSSGGPLKFTNSIILWLQCESEVLNKRLDNRVDEMLSRGLVNELLDFYEMYGEKLSAEKNHKTGIFQSIGFKEFYDFLILDEEKRESDEGKKLFEKGVEFLKIVTRQYAKKQIKWMKNRFLRNGQRQMPPIFALDATDVSKWEDNVYKKAEKIVDCHIKGEAPPVEPLSVEDAKKEIGKVYECECGLFLVGKTQYDFHLKSNSHSRRMRKKARMESQQMENASNEAELSANYKN